MNAAILLISMFALLVSANGNAQSSSHKNLTVQVTGISPTSGKVGILIFKNAEGFPYDHKAAVLQKFVSAGEAANGFEFSGLEPGTYAVAVMHDTNSNGRLDTNLLGIPKEGYGVSNDALRMMGPPQFAECSFQLRATARTEIRMHY